MMLAEGEESGGLPEGIIVAFKEDSWVKVIVVQSDFVWYNCDWLPQIPVKNQSIKKGFY